MTESNSSGGPRPLEWEASGRYCVFGGMVAVGLTAILAAPMAKQSPFVFLLLVLCAYIFGWFAGALAANSSRERVLLQRIVLRIGNLTLALLAVGSLTFAISDMYRWISDKDPSTLASVSFFGSGAMVL